MVANSNRWGRDRFSPDELMDSLEEIRAEFKETRPERPKPRTVEEIVERKRRGHQGGEAITALKVNGTLQPPTKTCGASSSGS